MMWQVCCTDDIRSSHPQLRSGRVTGLSNYIVGVFGINKNLECVIPLCHIRARVRFTVSNFGLVSLGLGLGLGGQAGQVVTKRIHLL